MAFLPHFPTRMPEGIVRVNFHEYYTSKDGRITVEVATCTTSKGVNAYIVTCCSVSNGTMTPETVEYTQLSQGEFSSYREANIYAGICVR